MGSGERRINGLGDIDFHGQVGKNVARYAKETQQIGRDLASELDMGAIAARAAMGKLKKHPLLFGVDVRIRARWVTRPLTRGRELSKGISAEMVKFNLQYRREFLEIDDAGQKDKKFRGEVDL